jgi:hypothetical protein
MAIIRKSRGLTYIETLISTVVITFMIVASVNLMTSLYKDSLISQQKQYSLSLCSQQLDYLKSKGFNNLPPTPDSCLPDSNFTNLTPLQTCATGTSAYDTYHYVTVTSGTTQMIYKVYSCVEWAQEDGNGNLEGLPASSLTVTNPDIKQLTSIVTYMSNGVTKTSRLTSYLSDKTLNLTGATISGTVYKSNSSGTSAAPGAIVHIVGYSAYTGTASSTGAYSISNVPPGSYTLYADGPGLSPTNYTSNPVSISETVTSVTGINITCPQINGCQVSGIALINVPIQTPTPTLTLVPTNTPTPAVTTLILYATGAMSGKTQNWSNPTYIHGASDGNSASQGSGTNQMLYSEFDNSSSPANTCISDVRFKVYGEAGLFGSVACNFNFTQNSGTNWYNNAGGWTGTTSTYFTGSPFTLAAWNWNTFTYDIASIYTTWNWSEVNNLGVFFKVSPGFLTAAYIDSAWLEVDYYSCPPTFTATNTPAYTATPTATPPVYFAVGANVSSLDGMSAMATVGTNGSFTISNINCSASTTTTVISYLTYNSVLYYASVIVPMSTTSTVSIIVTLTATTGSTAIVTGFVKDSLGNYISGAEVDLSDSAGDSVPTNGGAFNFTNAVPGTNYTLKASMPGYTSASESLASVPGGAITNAGTLTLTQAGSMSGTITNGITGLPMGGIFVQAFDSGGNHVGSDAYSDSITGYYLITGIPVGSGYQAAITIDTTSYSITYPVTSDSKWHNLVITAGGTAINTNFKVVPIYVSLSGNVQMDSQNVSQGLNVVIYPSSVTIHASDYHYDLTTVYQQYSGHTRMIYPSYGFPGQGDGSFTIRVPVNTTYDIYAYYSFISYTGTPLNMTKTVAKYYKVLPSIAVGTSSLTGQNISGALGTWTAY